MATFGPLILSKEVKTVADRAYHQAWRANNADKVKEYAERYALKKKKLCRACGGPLPYPSPGTTYCSDRCRDDGRKTSSKQHRQRGQYRLDAYKLAQGCSRCGYDQCAAALDFHHLDSEDKEMRIKAQHFGPRGIAKTAQKELEKCIFLCANCHREEHYVNDATIQSWVT